MKLHSPTNYKAFVAFSQRLADAQIALVTRWEAVPYVGHPVKTELALSIKVGFFSWRAIIVGNEAEHLDTVRRYLRHSPELARRAPGLRVAPAIVQEGQFVVVERTGYEGGSPASLREIILDAGGDEEGVNYAVNTKEEKVLGYIPLTDGEAAQSVAELVHAGATSPVSRDDLVGALERWRDAAIDRLKGGDTSAGALATTWQKLANHWRNQPPSKGR